MQMKHIPFKTLLRRYRLRGKLSKTAIANYLEKTETYIRKLETDGYTPPTYEICLELIELFNLNPAEICEFLKSAFIERLKDDKKFFDRIYLDELVPIPTHKQIIDERKDALCGYQFKLKTKFETHCFKGKVSERFEEIVKEITADFDGQVIDILTQAHEVIIQLTLDPNVNIMDFIKGLKTISSTLLRNQFSSIQNLPALWSTDVQICTLDVQKKTENAVQKSFVRLSQTPKSPVQTDDTLTQSF